MYLKSIEMQGFKSFATKIELDFHDGITGIVGPNGSGKSNISDAVRWVLGEQSAKQLRGASMQDVIFSGTENRKPLSYAFVAITLDNSDHVLPIEFEEVTVARRVYRSGESEYLINGSVCRLKDVQELFFDTGIGKEGYSIIGQGQIEKILSGKPEDRRELFDEAAGIVKFKKRKMTAEKKLANEQENLVRVNDIIAELEHRVGPLENQSRKAKIYLAKKEELKALDINLFLIEMEEYAKQQKSTDEAYDIANNEYKETTELNEQIKAEYERLEYELEELDRTINQTKDSINDSSVTKEKLEGQINVLREQIKASSASDEIYQSRVEALKADRTEKESNLEKFAGDEKTQNEVLSGVLEKKAEVSSKLYAVKNQIADCNNGIEQGKQEIMDLLDKKANIKASQERSELMLEQARIRKAELNKDLLTRKQEEDVYTKAVTDIQAQYDEVAASIAAMKQEQDTMRLKDIEWKNKLNTLRESMEKNTVNYHKATSRLESLKNIAERYDGYGTSIRKVMEQKESNSGIHGVISDLIKVSRQYEVAVETALGGNIQNIVTADEETAKQMIRFLKENKFGRATFLPLTSVTGNKEKQNEDVLDEKGVIGFADELVECDDIYREVVSYLIGRNVVVDNLDNATALARKFKYSLHIVTLEGEYLRSGGSMTGGAFKNNSNLLSRNREIEELEKQIATLTEAIEKSKNREDEIVTARALLEDDVAEIAEKLQIEILKENTLRLHLDQAIKEKNLSDQRFETLRKESQDIEKSISSINTEKENFVASITKADERQLAIGDEAKDFEAQIGVLAVEENKLTEELTELGLEETKINSQIGFIHDNMTRVSEEIEKLDNELANISGEAEDAKADIEKKNNDIEEIIKTIAACDEAFRTLSEKLEEDQKKKEELNASHKDFFKQREEITDKLGRLDKEVFKLGEQKEKIIEAVENRNTYMWEEYELTLHAAMEFRNEELGSRGQLKSKITDTKNDIKGLGEVNVNAIEEYKEVSERYEFLSTQRDDLVEAEQTLLKIIEDLDAGMREQFSAKFADIQREFDKAFKDLFGGGHGTLELVEGEDILETGIRIIAQPPGKKLQSMVLLSGGEKALTAIALLFAIQNLKPSPFCLLDEIEAALDDSNVSRFANYLHKLTKNTQFIVITHRKGTMTAADRLYGITMQEKGVSTLVSVNLIENELTQ